MVQEMKWHPCIYHRDDPDGHASAFIREYFKDKEKKCLVVCGAGFDPRSAVVCEALHDTLGENFHGVFIKEERPNPEEELIKKADENLKKLEDMTQGSDILRVDIFAEDEAVVGGRNITSSLSSIDINSYTDIIVDLSALSVGISFPVVRYLYEKLNTESSRINLHLIAATNTDLDISITPIYSERVSYVHGFKGDIGRYGRDEYAKMWIPQLTRGRKSVLNQMHDSDLVDAHDICPILPFPGNHPRAADELVVEFMVELQSTWEVDSRNILYANENNPLDLYRTILKIDSERNLVFEEFGGSSLILSPVGSRVLSIGALMAALDRDLTVVYVEAEGYTINWTTSSEVEGDSPLLQHVWLYGDAYPESSVSS